MPILLGNLDISPDHIRTMEAARKVVVSLPARISIVGDVEDYAEGILEFLLVHAVRPMVAAGATVERQHYRADPKQPFPIHLLAPVPTLPDALLKDVFAAGRRLMDRKAATSPAAPPPADPPVCHEPECDEPPISESDFCGKHQD
jgi:hypothetical protein